jgi:hypothetical protein
MSNTLTVYRRRRLFGTKGVTKGSGHAKSVTKLNAQLGLGDSVLGKLISDRSQVFKTEEDLNATKIVAKKEDATPEEMVRYLDNFERNCDNKAVSSKMKEYTDYKKQLLAEYGVDRMSSLTDAAKAVIRKKLATKSFYFFEYQVVCSYLEGEKLHSTRRKVLSEIPEDSLKI